MDFVACPVAEFPTHFWFWDAVLPDYECFAQILGLPIWIHLVPVSTVSCIRSISDPSTPAGPA